MCNATLPPNAIRWLSAVMAWDGYLKVHYDIFLESYERQKNYQALTNRSLDELASMRGRADELILDIWNQVEAKYQYVTPNDTRLEKCRDYGLIYYYRSSEKVKEEKEISC